MLEYFIVAFSFALASLWFMQIKPLKKEGVKADYLHSISYIVIVVIFFPFVFLIWILYPEEYPKRYGKALAEIIRKGE